MVTLTSQPLRSTPAGSSAGVELRHTQTPFIATSRSAGSNCAEVVPMLASTRPQLGSCPKTAALKRLLRATLRLTSTASSSLAACRVVIAISWSAPSASLSSCMARSVQACVRAAVKSSGVGVMPLAPLARTVTVSLVDMHPSESSRSKLTRVAARSAASRSAAGTTASVVITTSIVARAGASMPAPFAIPPIDQPAPSTTTFLLTESVVMIASEAWTPPSADRAAMAASTPASRSSRSLASPMRPVEHTTTSMAPMPSPAATFSATACVVWKPSGPV